MGWGLGRSGGWGCGGGVGRGGMWWVGVVLGVGVGLEGVCRLLQWCHMSIMAFRFTSNSTVFQLLVHDNNTENIRASHHWPFVTGTISVGSTPKGQCLHVMELSCDLGSFKITFFELQAQFIRNAVCHRESTCEVLVCFKYLWSPLGYCHF